MRTVRRGMVAAALAFPLAFGTAGMAAAATDSGEQAGHASDDATPDRDHGRSAGDEVKDGEGAESANCEDTGQGARAWVPEALKNGFFGMGGDAKPGAAEFGGKSADEGQRPEGENPDAGAAQDQVELGLGGAQKVGGAEGAGRSGTPWVPGAMQNSFFGKSGESRETSKHEAEESRDDVPEEGRSATEHARDGKQEDCHHGTDKRDYGEDAKGGEARDESYGKDRGDAGDAKDSKDAEDSKGGEARDESYGADGDRSGPDRERDHSGDVTQSEPEYLG